MLFKANKILFGVFEAYIIGYDIARMSVFHGVENYPEGKGGPRQDYITKKDKQPGQGWEYQLFLPGIKIEEALRSKDKKNSEKESYHVPSRYESSFV